MQRLFAFIFRYRVAFVFVGVELFCLYLIYSRNDYQKYAMLNTTNAVTGNLHNTRSNVVEYFELDSKNEQLSRQNAELERLKIELKQQNAILRRRYDELKTQLTPLNPTDSTDSISNIVVPKNTIPATDSLPVDSVVNTFRIYSGKVVNNSVHLQNNYITINIGKRDGIEPGMGVLTKEGVVGQVVSSSNRYSLVASLLHTQSRTSAKIKKSNTVGTILWPGENPKEFELHFIPRHVNLTQGDTIVTSGYNAVFPEDYPIGIIKSFNLTDNQSFYDITVELIPNLSDLSYIYVVSKGHRQEQHLLESERQK